MQKHRYKLILFLLVSITVSIAQTGGDFTITKSTIASGGGTSNGGNFSLNATIGQADASNELTGGNFALNGGFWHPSINNDIIFKNGFEQ